MLPAIIYVGALPRTPDGKLDRKLLAQAAAAARPAEQRFPAGILADDRGAVRQENKARRANGSSAGPVDDPAYMKSLIRTALAFERAIALHRPLQYDGDVYMLSSRQRMHGADTSFLGQLFTGEVERHEVGTTHATALSPRNPAFASALLRCVSQIAKPRVQSRVGGHVATWRRPSWRR